MHDLVVVALAPKCQKQAEHNGEVTEFADMQFPSTTVYATHTYHWQSVELLSALPLLIMP